MANKQPPDIQTPAEPEQAAEPSSSLYQLVKAKLGMKLGMPLADYLRAERAKQPPTPFYGIARVIVAKSSVEVTHEAIRRWCAQLTAEPEATPPD